MPHRRVAVVIPVHDAADLLRDCLSSVVGQLLEGDEIVVVDERSTDATLAVCAEVGVRAVPNTRTAGPYGARNRGVEVTDARSWCSSTAGAARDRAGSITTAGRCPPPGHRSSRIPMSPWHAGQPPPPPPSPCT